MLSFDNETNKITMIVKDSGALTLAPDNYTFTSGDVAIFTVATKLEDEEPLIQKRITTFPENKINIALSAADTDVPVGTYYYDVQVNYADGEVDTVLGPARIQFKGGATY